MITDNPATCDCRRRPWVTLAMLGGLYSEREDGTRLVKCLDRDHCLLGAPIIDGHLGEHPRNMERPGCKWTGILVQDSKPCICGGWPWVRASTLKLVFHENISCLSPIDRVGCPLCPGTIVGVTNSRIDMHRRCSWSGIYVAVGSDVPPLGLKAPISLAP